MADGGRREKERKSRDGGGSGAIYRREESWARGTASGEGQTGLGRLGGEVAERSGGELHGGAAWRLGSAPRTRVSVGWCQEAGQVALESSLVSNWPWTRSTGSVRRAAGETEQQRGERWR